MSAASLKFVQQAKTTVADDRFLQIVARAKPKKRPHKLTRVAFRVSRLMEFCSLRELQNQTGHSVREWPLVVLKELFDNALDAAEEAEIAPVITITVSPGEIVIQDNGTGITEDRTLGKTQYPKEGVRHEQRSFARGYRISFAGSAADRWRVAAVLFVVVLR